MCKQIFFIFWNCIFNFLAVSWCKSYFYTILLVLLYYFSSRHVSEMNEKAELNQLNGEKRWLIFYIHNVIQQGLHNKTGIKKITHKSKIEVGNNYSQKILFLNKKGFSYALPTKFFWLSENLYKSCLKLK